MKSLSSAQDMFQQAVTICSLMFLTTMAWNRSRILSETQVMMNIQEVFVWRYTSKIIIINTCGFATLKVHVSFQVYRSGTADVSFHWEMMWQHQWVIIPQRCPQLQSPIRSSIHRPFKTITLYCCETVSMLPNKWKYKPLFLPVCLNQNNSAWVAYIYHI
jgi:hypothetical protein